MIDHQNVQNKSCKHFRGTILLLQLGCSSRKCLRCALLPGNNRRPADTYIYNLQFCPLPCDYWRPWDFSKRPWRKVSLALISLISHFDGVECTKFKTGRDWKKCNRFEVEQSRQFTTSVRKNVQTAVSRDLVKICINWYKQGEDLHHYLHMIFILSRC